MRTLVAAGALLTLALAPLSGAEPPADQEKERIDQVVVGLLEAYRAANYEHMARYYAPEVALVSARFEPLIRGWANVRQAYLGQEVGLKYVELAREDTVIERRGKLAWVYYRWTFVGQVRDQYVTTLGHTTLILEKRGRDWLIVYNHSSAAAPPGRPETPAAPPPR
jgi:ketosteroid isomerase-like protein